MNDYPLYKGENGDVLYPVFDRKNQYKVQRYGTVIEFK